MIKIKLLACAFILWIGGLYISLLKLILYFLLKRRQTLTSSYIVALSTHLEKKLSKWQNYEENYLLLIRKLITNQSHNNL